MASRRGNQVLVIVLCVFLVVSMISCSPAASRQPAYGRSEMPVATHSYSLRIVDADKKPLDGATVSYKFYDRDVLKDTSDASAPGGDFYKSFAASSDPQFRYVKSFRSKFEYAVSKEGYYSKSGTLTAYKEGQQKQDATVTMLRPIDYLNAGFAASPAGAQLKDRILAFITAIRLKSLLNDADLKVHSINLAQYKNRTYLQFGFNTFNSYNSLKLNKYDIGKTLFDEVVRKVLSPMNESISDPKAFYGYDLSVTGYTKSFADKYATSKAVEYRYIMPESLVRKYKNQDVSGQQLLDGSVILMDDERIELKLQ